VTDALSAAVSGFVGAICAIVVMYVAFTVTGSLGTAVVSAIAVIVVAHIIEKVLPR